MLNTLLIHILYYKIQNVLSALEIFLSMRYVNLHFTYLLTYFEVSGVITSMWICLQDKVQFE